MEFSKSKLDNMLKNPFRKDESSHSGLKSKQLEEFQRLKSICFPKDRERQTRHDRSFSNANRNDTSIDKGHSRNTSFFLERTRNLSISKDQSQSFMLNTKQNDMSFNMSPLKGKLETEADISFDHDLNKRMPMGVLDEINQNEDVKDFATQEWATLADCKTHVARNNYLKVVNHYSNEMMKFFNGLSEAMKNVSLTKMSEKSINLMMKKYVTKLESIKEQWSYPTSDDGSNNIKGFITTLSLCITLSFEEILEKLKDLLSKLKNFNGSHFQELTNRGILSSLQLILQQNYDLATTNVLSRALGIISQLRATAACQRLGNLLKPKLAMNKLHAFTQFKFHMRSLESTDIQQRKNLIANNFGILLQKHLVSNTYQAFNAMKLINYTKAIKEDINLGETQKSLIMSLLNNVSNEAKFFETLNNVVSGFIKCPHVEVLIVDKVHRTVSGYPYSVNNIQNVPNDATPDIKVNRALLFNTEDVHLDESGEQNEFNRKFEFSYEEESILKFVILNKEILSSTNLPQITLYNKGVDVPLCVKFSTLPLSETQKSRNAQFLYFPLCNASKAVIGVVRVFFARDEKFDSLTIEKLSKISEIMIPILEQVNLVKKKFNYLQGVAKKVSTRQEAIFKALIQDCFTMIHWADQSTIMRDFSKILYQYLQIDNLSIFALTEEEKMVKIFADSKLNTTLSDIDSESNENRFKYPYGNNRPRFIGNVIIPLKIKDPATGKEIGLIELEKVTFDGQTNERDYSEGPTDLIGLDRVALNSLPDIMIDFLCSVGMLALNKTHEPVNPKLEETVQAFRGQIDQLETFNKGLEERLHHLQILYEFNIKLRTCTNFEDIVLLFNETIAKAHYQIDVGGVFFVNPDGQGYFTFNFNHSLSKSIRITSIDNSSAWDSLLVFKRGDQLLTKIFDSCQPNLVLNVDIDKAAQSSPYKGATQLKSLQGIKVIDFEKENVLINLEFNQAEIFEDPVNNKQTFKPKKYPQNILATPLVSEEKVLGYVVIGKYSMDRIYNDIEESFLGEIGQLVENFLVEHSKTQNFIKQITTKLQKSKINSSKMKAYEAILFNQNLRPEYSIYKKQRTLQSFLGFLENTFTTLLGAQHTRILLYNERKHVFYHYVNFKSTNIKEFNQNTNTSITASTYLTNDTFVYPPLNIERSNTEQDDIYVSFRSPSPQKKHKNPGSFNFNYPLQKENQTLQTNQTFESVNRSLNSSFGGHPVTLDRCENFNCFIDVIDLNRAEKKASPQGKTNTSPSKARRITTVLFHPLRDHNNKPIGVIQAFNKSELNVNYNKKDVMKAIAITEAIFSKLTKMMIDPSRLYPKNIQNGLDILSKVNSSYKNKEFYFAFAKLKAENHIGYQQARNSKEISGAFNILEILYQRQKVKGFETLKLNILDGRLKNQKKIVSQKELEFKMIIAARIVYSLLKKKELKEKGFYFKKFYDTKVITSFVSYDQVNQKELNRLKALVLKNLFSTIQFKWIGSGFRGLKWHMDHLNAIKLDRNLQKNTINIVSLLSKLRERKMKSGFSSLVDVMRTRKHEKNILMAFLEDSERTKSNITQFFVNISQYLTQIYSELQDASVVFLDTDTKKIIKWNNITKDGFTDIERDRNNTLYSQYHSILEEYTPEVNVKKSETRYVKYTVIDVKHQFIPFKGPKIVIECSFMQDKMRPLTKYSVEYIKLLFLNSMQRTKLNLSNLLLIAKKYHVKTQAKAFHEWYSFAVTERNNEILNQTTVQFKDVEENMQHLENNIKKYQTELEEYEDRMNIANKELAQQKEENKKLKLKLEEINHIPVKKPQVELGIRLLLLSEKLQKKGMTKKTSFEKWRAFSFHAKMAQNALKKILKINHKHINARYQAATTILGIFTKQKTYHITSNAFKQLVYFSIPRNDFSSKSNNKFVPEKPSSKPSMILIGSENSKKERNTLNEIKIFKNNISSNSSQMLSQPASHFLSQHSSIQTSNFTSTQSLIPNDNKAKIVKNAFSPFKANKSENIKPVSDFDKHKHIDIKKILSSNDSELNIKPSDVFARDDSTFLKNNGGDSFDSPQKLADQILGESPFKSHPDGFHITDLSQISESSPMKMFLDKTKKIKDTNSSLNLSFENIQVNLIKENLMKSPLIVKNKSISPNKPKNGPHEKLMSALLEVKNNPAPANKVPTLKLDNPALKENYSRHLQTLDSLLNKELNQTKKITYKDSKLY